MAYPVYTIRMLVGNIADSGSAKATVPAGHRWVVLNSVWTPNGVYTAARGILLIPGVAYVHASALPATQVSLTATHHSVLEEGEQLEAIVTGTGTSGATVLVTGWQFVTAQVQPVEA